MEAAVTRTKRGTKFSQFYLCCGAGIDNGGKRLLAFGKDTEQALRNSQRAFVLTDIEVPGATMVCPGIWLMSYGQEWSNSYPRQEVVFQPYDASDRWAIRIVLPQNQPILSGKALIVSDFCSSSLRGTFDAIKLRAQEGSDKDQFAILAGHQHVANEAPLLDSGFKVLDRRISPRTGSRLTIYHRSPGPVE